MARVESAKPYIGQITNARQLIRHRNIMLGLPIKHLKIATIPWGYEIDPDKDGWLRPVQKQLEALYYARKFGRRSTRKQLAAWVTKETGRYMTWQSLRIILRTRPPLSAYLLDLNDRLAIATSETEDTAIYFANYKAEWRKNTYPKAAKEYTERRIKAVERKETARRIASLKERPDWWSN